MKLGGMHAGQESVPLHCGADLNKGEDPEMFFFCCFLWHCLIQSFCFCPRDQSLVWMKIQLHLLLHQMLTHPSFASACSLSSTSSLPPSLSLSAADFGFARYLQTNMMAATLCGSPMYMVSTCCILYIQESHHCVKVSVGWSTRANSDFMASVCSFIAKANRVHYGLGRFLYF